MSQQAMHGSSTQHATIIGLVEQHCDESQEVYCPFQEG
jgi:hypothetical protein